jgi:hypothetical protein
LNQRHFSTTELEICYIYYQQERNACRILVGKPEEKRPLGRPRHRWVDNIKMDLKIDRMRWSGLD